MKKMSLTSRDKILGFKRKMNFWKTSCYKKNLEMLPLLLGLDWRRISTSLKSYWKPVEKLQNELIFLPFQHSASLGRNSFPESSEHLTWEKMKKSCSLTHSRWVLLIYPQKSSGFLWSKEYTATHRKTMNIMLQLSTSHTYEQSLH